MRSQMEGQPRHSIRKTSTCQSSETNLGIVALRSSAGICREDAKKAHSSTRRKDGYLTRMPNKKKNENTQRNAANTRTLIRSALDTSIHPQSEHELDCKTTALETLGLALRLKDRKRLHSRSTAKQEYGPITSCLVVQARRPARLNAVQKSRCHKSSCCLSIHPIP